MNYLLGVLFLAVGAGLLVGDKRASYILFPEAWLWKNIVGIEVGPLYRKTQGVFFVITGIVLLALGIVLTSAL